MKALGVVCVAVMLCTVLLHSARAQYDPYYDDVRLERRSGVRRPFRFGKRQGTLLRYGKRSSIPFLLNSESAYDLNLDSAQDEAY